MRARDALITGVVVALVLTTPVTVGAQEDTTGVIVAPGRRFVPAGDTRANVYIVNNSTRTADISVRDWAFTEGSWHATEVAGLSMDPMTFTLDPREQQKVVVRIPSANETPCRLVGVGAAVEVAQVDGVIVRGNAISQLALGGVGSVESDCLATVREAAPDVPDVVTAGPSIPWGMFGAIAGGVLLIGAVYLAGRRRGRNGRPRRSDLGFGKR